MNLFELQTESKQKCFGEIFRADVQNYITKRGFGFTVRLNKIKHLSCPGCLDCRWQEQFSEVNNDWPLIGIDEVEHGRLYYVVICNESRDWESGLIDQWDLKLVEITEKEIIDGNNHV